MSGPVPNPGILEISPYVPGRSPAKSQAVFKLSSNESPFGASPQAKAAFAEKAQLLELYPDGSATALRQAIAKYHRIDADRIVCGAGSDELLQLLAHAYLKPGDEAIYTQHGFLVYPIAIQSNGAKAIVATEREFTADVDEILKCVSPLTKIVFLANPNNPTGTYLPFHEVKRLHRALPASVLLVLDAAYAEYVRETDYLAGIELVEASPNVVMTRTFSKIYGLAGARLGWAYCPPAIADVLNRIRGPFNVSAGAVAAGIAALADMAFVEASIAHNTKWLALLTKEVAKLGLRVTPSVGNFILVHFPGEGSKTAALADDYLLRQGLAVRRMEAYGLPCCLRITVGSEPANRALLAALTDFMT